MRGKDINVAWHLFRLSSEMSESSTKHAFLILSENCHKIMYPDFKVSANSVYFVSLSLIFWALHNMQYFGGFFGVFSSSQVLFMCFIFLIHECLCFKYISVNLCFSWLLLRTSCTAGKRLKLQKGK